MSLGPIGIFDSGIGGLTVARAIKDVLPNQKLVYFGDTAHLPYGDKSDKAVLSYALKISAFLVDYGCKIVVIACNTASAIAYKELKESLDHKNIKVFNVIDPVVDLVCGQTKGHTIGVICTRATARSQVYENKIHQMRQDLEVKTLATPLLAPMIEDGFVGNKVSKYVLEEYLGKNEIKGIDTLILGCTHYPLLRPEVEENVGKNVDVVDSARSVAAEVKAYVDQQENSRLRGTEKDHFFVSDLTQNFAQLSRFFFGEKVNLELADIWRDE